MENKDVIKNNDDKNPDVIDVKHFNSCNFFISARSLILASLSSSVFSAIFADIPLAC